MQLTLAIVNAWRSPFSSWEIDKLLDAVARSTESVHFCSEDIREELIVGTYSTTMDIKSQMEEVLRQQRMMQASIDVLTERLSMVLPTSILGVPLRSG